MKKNTTTHISVVMPVYNAGRYLHQSIQSILDQTHANFTFYIVNDASTDNSNDILKDYAQKDDRIVLIQNSTNLGVSRSVKRAIKRAEKDHRTLNPTLNRTRNSTRHNTNRNSNKNTDNRSTLYIARMDADDISKPKRFEKQLDHLEKNQDTVAVGTQCTTIDKNGRTIGQKSFPTEHEDIYNYIFRFIPMQQPSMMIARHRLPKDFAFYNDSFTTAEEVELIFKLFEHGKVANLSQKLLKYRIHDTNTSFKHIKKTFFNTLLSRIQAVYTYNYRPSISGIAFTVAQTLAVLVLPEHAIMSIYRAMRSIKSRASSTRRWAKSLAFSQ